MNGAPLDALLIQPPPGDLTGPYPASAYLKAYAEKEGFRVRVEDLGIKVFHFLAQEKEFKRLMHEAKRLQTALEAERFPGPAGLNRYRILGSAMAHGATANPALEAAGIFQNPKQFYVYRQYKRACTLLEAFYKLLSALYYPTLLSPSEYCGPGEFANFDDIFSHRSRTLNPFIDYYETALFPEIYKIKPSVVGISMVFASQAVQALVLGKLIKERFPDIHLTLGGAFLSQWALVMDEPLLLKLFACTDSIVCGEGEKAFSQLLEYASGRRSLKAVGNLIYLDRSTGRIERFSELEYTDLSSLPPPDYTDLDLGLYLSPEPVIPYCISRGCYWGRCVFCQNRYGDNHMRRYQAVPVEKAVDEISNLSKKHGSAHFNFSNDAIDPAYLKRFSEAVLRGGKKFSWNTDLRAEKNIDPPLCSLMSRAGLNSVAIGFESGCQKTLDAMDKGYRVETIRRVMKNLYDARIATQAMGFFGFPGESHEEGLVTLRFIEDNIDRISYYVMGLLMVLPGSRMYDDPEKYGITSITYEKNPLRLPLPVWRSGRRISAAQVENLYKRLNRLEEIYEINDYPYAGGLSTNHSFLYFKLGPDILKRLKLEEKKHSLSLLKASGSKNGALDHKRLRI